MGTRNIVVGEFENAFYANVARLDLLNAGIKTTVRNSYKGIVPTRQIEPEAVQLIVDQDQLELAEKILVKKFVDESTLFQILLK